jgi:polyphosphate kinase
MDAKDKFFDRELSALEFNARVLAEGMDPANPLLERLKFIGIVSSNLDEFFMVRVASLQESSALSAIRQRAFELMREQNSYFLETIVPELAGAGLTHVQPEVCDAARLDYLRGFFVKEVLPILTPIALTPERPFPTLANLRLHMAVTLAEASRKEPNRFAVVELPHKIIPRLIFLPSEAGHPFVLLEDLVMAFVADLFPGYEVLEKGLVRLTRGAELTLDEEKDEDFMRVMTEALRKRQQGTILRMEIAAPPALRQFFKEQLQVSEEQIYENNSWFDLKTISQLSLQPGFESLKRPVWEPRANPDLERTEDLWSLLKEKDVLVMHPYESFEIITRLLESAAEDPDVLAIKQTLYRIDADSAILRTLERAAEKGKRVTVLIELKARFDEETNIEWARRLSAAGVSVLYGIAGLKTHAKVCLVVRREREGIKRYVHLSTGNYNEKTARLYSDIGYFTSRDELASDISAFFNMITGYSQPAFWSKIEVAPYGLRKRLLRMIRREALRATPEHPGRIRAKMNSLADPDLIEALYQASNAGVRIQLNVRGICCLRPGMKGLSENIEVVSIVDQFLEHSRIFHFANGGEDEVYLSSADWMPRNLDRRIEMLFPIEDAACKHTLTETLDVYFRDNAKAWALQPDGRYKRVEPGNRRRFRAQEALCQRAIEQERSAAKSMPTELRPQKPKVSL